MIESAASLPVNRQAVLLGNHLEMGQTRGRNAVPLPTVHGSHRGLGSTGDNGCAAHCRDQVAGEIIHAPLDAIITTSSQAQNCDNRNCDYRKSGVDGFMDTKDIRARMRALNLKQVDLANLLGIDPVKISRTLAGQRQFKSWEMDRLRQVLNVTTPDQPPAARTIPVIGQVSAGAWREAVQTSTATMPAPDPGVSRNAFALDIVGDSMDLVVQDGGRVIVDPDDKALYPKRLFVVLNGEGETTFKKFQADPARLDPCSSNPKHQPIMLGSGEGFTVVGRVTWIASPV
jgi:repressor LexA